MSFDIQIPILKKNRKRNLKYFLGASLRVPPTTDRTSENRNPVVDIIVALTNANT